MGHAYTPIFRVTPLAGPAFTVPLSGYSWVTRAQPLYERVTTDHEMIDRGIEQTPYGFRVRVALEFEFPTPSTNETDLAQDVIDHALNEDSGIEISLDNGTTYRAVVLEEYGQAAIAEKNIGVRTTTLWVCKELIANKPPVGSGAW